MPAHRFALKSIQTLAELQGFPLYLDTTGIFAEKISTTCRIPADKFTGSLVLGDLEDLREVWITSNVKPELMQAKYKRVI